MKTKLVKQLMASKAKTKAANALSMPISRTHREFASDCIESDVHGVLEIRRIRNIWLHIVRHFGRHALRFRLRWFFLLVVIGLCGKIGAFWVPHVSLFSTTVEPRPTHLWATVLIRRTVHCRCDDARENLFGNSRIGMSGQRKISIAVSTSIRRCQTHRRSGRFVFFTRHFACVFLRLFDAVFMNLFQRNNSLCFYFGLSTSGGRKPKFCRIRKNAKNPIWHLKKKSIKSPCNGMPMWICCPFGEYATKPFSELIGTARATAEQIDDNSVMHWIILRMLTLIHLLVSIHQCTGTANANESESIMCLTHRESTGWVDAKSQSQTEE